MSSKLILVALFAFVGAAHAQDTETHALAAQTFEGSLDVEQEKSLFTNKGASAMTANITLEIVSMPPSSAVTVTAHLAGGGIQNLCAAYMSEEGLNGKNTCLNTPVPAGARISVACSTANPNEGGGIPGCGYNVTVQ